MIVMVAFLIGGGFGWFKAAKRGGLLADKLQWAFGFAAAFALISLFITIILSKLILG